MQGPIFTNLLLADEINRTPPKTMQPPSSNTRTICDGRRNRGLADPFLVFATQNPIEQEGTYPLPEAQLDRFMLMIEVGYPTEEEDQHRPLLLGRDTKISSVLTKKNVTSTRSCEPHARREECRDMR